MRVVFQDYTTSVNPRFTVVRAIFFGGEKRFENSVQEILIHTMAVVTDRHQDKITGTKSRV